VPDNVLLKQGKLTREERITMNAHPVLGAQIIGPVDRLAPELPVIRHHHEWYNGSGYPDRLMGDEIPKLARILHVADAFEAMTADRPYRKALSTEQALAELRKFAGVQFDPRSSMRSFEPRGPRTSTTSEHPSFARSRSWASTAPAQRAASMRRHPGHPQPIPPDRCHAGRPAAVRMRKCTT
jgi:hypothetical protein